MPTFEQMSWSEPVSLERPYEVTLDMDKYVAPLPPGEYQVVVQHHNSMHISALSDVSRLILLESDPVKLIVE
jgi:hypothetical protein